MEVEKNEYYMAVLEKMIDRVHFIDTLHLPLDYKKTLNIVWWRMRNLQNIRVENKTNN
ncbi:hypothetical protein ABS764_06615 [Flavobacterium sp. ST-87]|uniref:Uncharacterized protein n=1 Tax=Flavobacterium plantiphilum TaxID=3163297 RepID=A0ABW8XTR3_9FLAO